MKAKTIAVVLIIGGLALLAWLTRPVHQPIDFGFENPIDRVHDRLRGLTEVKSFEFSEVPLDEVIAQLNRCFENSSAKRAGIVFRAWQEGDAVPKEMHRIGAIPVSAASRHHPIPKLESAISMRDMELRSIPFLLASVYRCELAVSEDAIVFFPEGSLVCDLIDKEFYLMWKVRDPTRDFPGARLISAGKWDLKAWAASNGLKLSVDGFARYEKGANKIVVRAPRNEMMMAVAALTGSCLPHYADSPLERIQLKAYDLWQSVKQGNFPPPPMPATPFVPNTPDTNVSDGIPGLDPIPSPAEKAGD